MEFVFIFLSILVLFWVYQFCKWSAGVDASCVSNLSTSTSSLLENRWARRDWSRQLCPNSQCVHRQKIVSPLMVWIVSVLNLSSLVIMFKSASMHLKTFYSDCYICYASSSWYMTVSTRCGGRQWMYMGCNDKYICVYYSHQANIYKYIYIYY